MNPSTRRILAAVALAALTAPGCSKLATWPPVRDDVAGGGDHIIYHGGIEIHVYRFGVWDDTGEPTAEIRIDNQGQIPLAMALGDARVEIGGELVAPRDHGEILSVYLEPLQQYNTRLTFMSLVSPDGQQAVPEYLYLRLPPVLTKDGDFPLPALTYRNPER
jgi:hypothetical protein